MLSALIAKWRKIYNCRIKGLSLEAYKILVLREQGMAIGENVKIYSDLFSKEPYMISIGDNTTISGNVTVVTHDNSISKYLPEYTDMFGRITIGKNCFIGMGSTIMAGVTIADNTIVGAGAVVTKSVRESGCVLVGVPAKVVGKVDTLKLRNEKFGFNITGLGPEEKRRLLEQYPEKLITK